MNFNSIKVRLKHFYRPNYSSNPKFQFHKGTIKTFDVEYVIVAPSFQFHKGTIKTTST